MEKIIYQGPETGLFEQGNFMAFLNRYKGAQTATDAKDNYVGYVFAAHISPQNVTLAYERHHKHVTVTLLGRRTGIGEVEKIILKAAQKASTHKQHYAGIGHNCEH